jgi:hypothetical protein
MGKERELNQKVNNYKANPFPVKSLYGVRIVGRKVIHTKLKAKIPIFSLSATCFYGST